MSAWQQEVQNYRLEERWRRVSGIAGLSRRSLAIVRELWRWRDSEAERRDSPPRRVLRDDLIVELARRRSADPKHIRAVRGMERGDLRRAERDLVEAIARGLAIPEEECPRIVHRENGSQWSMLSQFLSSALASICRSAEVAPSIVGTASDVRDVIAFRLDPQDQRRSGPPALTQGWRAQVVGRLLDELLAGEVAIRIQDPTSEHPLTFERSPRGRTSSD